MEYSVGEQNSRQRIDVVWDCNNCGRSQSRIGFVGEGSLGISCENCGYSFGSVDMTRGSWKDNLNEIKERQEIRSHEEIQDVMSILRYRDGISFVIWVISYFGLALGPLFFTSSIEQVTLLTSLLFIFAVVFVTGLVALYICFRIFPYIAGKRAGVDVQTANQIYREAK